MLLLPNVASFAAKTAVLLCVWYLGIQMHSHFLTFVRITAMNDRDESAFILVDDAARHALPRNNNATTSASSKQHASDAP